jgi:hypothetical protein
VIRAFGCSVSDGFCSQLHTSKQQFPYRAHIFEKRFNMKAVQESGPVLDKRFSYVVRQVYLPAFFFRSLNSTYRCLLAYNLE